MRRIALLLAAAGLSACAAITPSYVYQPTEPPELVSDDRGSVRYYVPRARPQGEVRVSCLGITQPKPTPGSEDLPTPRVHVRLFLWNLIGTQPWLLDTRRQILSYQRGPQVLPTAAEALGRNPPIVAVLPDTTVEVDLYFDLPPSSATASDIAGFDFIWQLSVGAAPSAGSVRFARREPLKPGQAIPVLVSSPAAPVAQ